MAGTFHDFHNGWIFHLKEAMNAGLLPEGYHAQSGQHVGVSIAGIAPVAGGPAAAMMGAAAGGPTP
jgi:hypothetical protein